MIDSDIEFSRIALAFYDNPSCVSLKEFEADIRRFVTLNRYLNNNPFESEKDYRKLINYLIVIYNIFGNKTNSLLRYKISEENLPRVISVVAILNRLDEDLGDISEMDTKFFEKIKNVTNRYNG